MSAQAPTPKVWPVADGAWQIRLPLPWELVSVNAFLFRQSDGFVLLDTGIRSDESLQLLEAAMETAGCGWDSIREILISHLHPDHIGAAAEIRRRTGAPVRMPEGEASYVRPLGPHRKFFAETTEFLQRHGMPGEQVDALRESAKAGSMVSERLDVDGFIEVGQRIRFEGGTLEAIPAPGHSPALLCFHCQEQRVLFSTDAILPKITPNIGVHWFYDDDPLGDYFGTLERLRAVDADLVVPSHGRPFRGHREWVDRTKEHHVRRCDVISGVINGQPLDAYQIAGSVWGEERSLMDRRFAMSESLSHLAYMALQGRVSRIQDGGITRWSRA